MTVLLTGASGFLGQHIHSELARYHSVLTLGRTPLSPAHIVCDLAELVPTLPDIPVDYVVHAAGKAHAIPRNARDKSAYQRVNVQGTAHLLTALDRLSKPPKAFVFISSILVYGRTEGQGLTEATALGASDAYGISKVGAEALVGNWGKQTGTRVAILRLPLVVAQRSTGNLASMQRAIRRGYYVRIGNKRVRRSMVRADNVASIISKVAETGGTYHLTDGCHPAVCELEDAFIRQTGRTKLPVLPLALARTVAHLGDGYRALTGQRLPFDSNTLQKLTSTLTFSDYAARQHLDWNPQPVLDLFV